MLFNRASLISAITVALALSASALPHSPPQAVANVPVSSGYMAKRQFDPSSDNSTDTGVDPSAYPPPPPGFQAFSPGFQAPQAAPSYPGQDPSSSQDSGSNSDPNNSGPDAAPVPSGSMPPPPPYGPPGFGTPGPNPGFNPEAAYWHAQYMNAVGGQNFKRSLNELRHPRAHGHTRFSRRCECGQPGCNGRCRGGRGGCGGCGKFGCQSCGGRRRCGRCGGSGCQSCRRGLSRRGEEQYAQFVARRDNGHLAARQVFDNGENRQLPVVQKRCHDCGGSGCNKCQNNGCGRPGCPGNCGGNCGGNFGGNWGGNMNYNNNFGGGYNYGGFGFNNGQLGYNPFMGSANANANANAVSSGGGSAAAAAAAAAAAGGGGGSAAAAAAAAAAGGNAAASASAASG